MGNGVKTGFGKLVGVAVAGMLALSSCGTVPHDSVAGQTRAEAREALEAVPGITVASFSGGDKPNVKGNTGYAVEFEIEPGYIVERGDLLIDYVVRLIWSIGEGYMPTEELRLVVTTAEWEPHFDLVAATEAAQLTAKATQIGDRNTVLIPVDIDHPDGERNLSRIATNGRWPIDVPAPLPLDVTVKRG
jgi:hypothetical protein